VTIIYRPSGKPRFGSQGERIFATLNSGLFHLLAGNTQLRKNVRQMTDDVDPDRHAIWTLPELSKVVEKFCFEQYDSMDHSELLVSPRHMYELGMERHGVRPVRLIPYNKQFIITTCPSTVKGTAKVQPDGVKIEYIMYSHPELEKHIGASVPVRYDPFDKSRAWAYVQGQWLELKTRHKNVLRLFTDRTLELAIVEWKRRRNLVAKKRLNEPTLVKFLQEILETETLLKERRRAAEERRLRSMSGDDVDDAGDNDAQSPVETALDGDGEFEASDDAFSLDADSIQVLEAA
jgi:putative transposase